MADGTLKIHRVAKIVALIFAGGFFAFFLFGIALANRPLPLIDKIVEVLMGLYLIGLLVGLKWPGIGGLLSVILPTFEIIHIVSSGFSITNHEIIGSIAIYLVLIIPSILYFLAWRNQLKPVDHEHI